MTSIDNNKFKTYLFSYNYDGCSWCFEIQAESPEDARKRVSRLTFASYDGELVAKIPATLGIPTKAIIALRNRTHGLLRFLRGSA
jgi:hypothetical protein